MITHTIRLINNRVCKDVVFISGGKKDLLEKTARNAARACGTIETFVEGRK